MVLFDVSAQGVEEAVFDVALDLKGVLIVRALNFFVVEVGDEAAALVLVTEAEEGGDGSSRFPLCSGVYRHTGPQIRTSCRTVRTPDQDHFQKPAGSHLMSALPDAAPLTCRASPVQKIRRRPVRRNNKHNRPGSGR